MRVLILGAKGMLGCELMKVFKDFEVFGWDKEEIEGVGILFNQNFLAFRRVWQKFR